MKIKELLRPFYYKFILEALLRAVAIGACFAMGLFCAVSLAVHLWMEQAPEQLSQTSEQLTQASEQLSQTSEQLTQASEQLSQTPKLLAQLSEHPALWAVVVFLLVSLICFLRRKPSMQDTARRIDHEFNLESRAATALTFDEDASLMAKMQRQDAMERLQAVFPKDFFIRIPQKTPLIAAALLVASIGMTYLPYGILCRSAVAEEKDVDAQQANFEGAIQRLEKERTEQTAIEKENVAAMEDFLSKLEELKKDNGVETTKVTTEQVKSITELEVDVSEAMNAYMQFLAALLTQEHWKVVGTALLTGDAYTIEEAFHEMGDNLIALPMPEEAEAVSACARELKAAFACMDKEAQEMKVSVTLRDAMYELEWIGGFYKDDKESCDRDVSSLFETLGGTFFDYYATNDESQLKKQSAPQKQNPNAKVEVRSITKTASDRKKKSKDALGEGTGGVRDETTMGNSEYSDKVMTFDPYLSDPNLGEYVPYGKVYGLYYSEMSEERAKGSIPDDVEEAIDNYFGAL